MYVHVGHKHCFVENDGEDWALNINSVPPESSQNAKNGSQVSCTYFTHNSSVLKYGKIFLTVRIGN